MMISVGRAPGNYIDVVSWGGDLPLGVCTEVVWDPSYADCPGIGGTTGETLLERWVEESDQPLSRSIGLGYYVVQVLIDAIERAGTLDTDAVNKAVGETDLITISGRVKFDQNRFHRIPISYGQWQKTDSPEVWEFPIIFSAHDFIPVGAEPVFPITYD